MARIKVFDKTTQTWVYADKSFGKDGVDGVSPTVSTSKSGNITTIAITDKNGTKTATISDGAKGDKGDTGPKGDTGAAGERGTSIIKVTTGPSAYTTTTGGFTPTHRIALSTVLSESGVDKVMVGDTLAYSYYQWLIGYIDTSHVYLGGRSSLRGATGEDGTSVTVKSVTESTTDGGSNVVTFSDGKTVTIKNGSKGSTGDAGATGQRGTGLIPVTTAPSSYTTAVGGITPKYRMAISTIKTQAGVTEVLLGDTVRYSYYHYPIDYLDSSYAYFETRVSIRGATGAAGKDGADGLPGVPGADGNDGYTPVRGVDYWTPTDKAEIEAYIATELAKRGQLEPLFANSIEECTDTTKLYVLPDGFIYAYMLTEVEAGPSYKNWLTYSVNKDGTDYVGDNGEDGYRKGYRYSSSSAAEKAATGYDCIGWIPVNANDVVRIANVGNINANTDSNMYATAYHLNSSFGAVGGAIYLGNQNNQMISIENGVYTYAVPNNTAIKWVKLTLMGVTADTIITVNEEITEGGGTTITHTWASTGHAFVPADYEDRIVAVENTTAHHTAKITALEKAVKTGGADASVTAAYNRIKNWKYPIHEDAPVFLLESDKPAIASSEQNTDAVYAKYDALMNANPGFVSKVNCGMASDGTTPIYVYHFKEAEPHYSGPNWSETKPVILVCSGVHPTEQSGVHSLYYAMEEITTNPKLLDLRRNVHFIVMPMINPTGFTDTTYGVRNPNGIQVHYNFEVDFKYPTDPYYVAHGNRNHGGETPLSIPETQYFDALMEEYKDTLAIVVSCHNNDVDEQYGTGFIWCSCATHFMCNLGFRFADKMSAAWRDKHGTAFDEGVRWANEYALAQASAGTSGIFTTSVTKEQPEWDYRVGRASISGSGGTEYKQALKYGVHGVNVETCDRCMVLDKDFNKKRTANVTTMGCETYVNFFRTFMAAYDPKDKKDYAPNLPWEN